MVSSVTSFVSSRLIAVIVSAVIAENSCFCSLKFLGCFFIISGRYFRFDLTVPTAYIALSYRSSSKLQLVKKLSKATSVFIGRLLLSFVTTL